ncbi:MAG TPA: hypothetical protein VK760_04860 [Candidatus Acidoferrales bacterium]|jgi:hypothetical protein|nr:hypothetical protein [Candidatus Acidoferrales bacterium]
MKTPFAKLLGSFLLALTLAACNSGGGSTNNPSNFPNCTAPGQFVGIYPIGGSANVPDSTQFVYVASSVTLGGQYQNVIGVGGSLFPGNSFSQVPLSQVPTPHAKPGFANPIYYVTALPNLSSATTYTMLLNNTNSANCVPVQYLQFSTQ